MSLETWKEEFIPVPAKDQLALTDMEALQLAFLKWRGLLAHNVAKHGLSLDKVTGALVEEGDDYTQAFLVASASHCGLCLRDDTNTESRSEAVGYLGDCTTCPLYASNMNQPISNVRYENTCDAAYHSLGDKGTPTPMLIRITNAILWQNR